MKAFLLIVALLFASQSMAAALGTSVVADVSGDLLRVQAESAQDKTHVIWMRSKDRGATWSQPKRITTTPEPVSADGENRPKIVVGKRGELFVTWTSPTSTHYTGDIRFTRSVDSGAHWSTPRVVHRDRQLITHRFESLQVDANGRIWAAWIDKRDLKIAEAKQQAYAGAAIYYAYSDDGGEHWQGDFKLADHSCECCRIALSLDAQGRVVALWRHVFANSERDHATAVLTANPAQLKVERATFDRWRIDACPHHGPSLAIAADGVRHAVWFNDGHAWYGQLRAQKPAALRALPEGATHPDVVVNGNTLAVAWKRFDGEATRAESWLSHDGGRTFVNGPSRTTTRDSDQPHLVAVGTGVVLFWRDEDAVTATMMASSAAVSTFERDTLARIEAAHRGQPFWLVLWDLECTYCLQSLKHVAEAQRRSPHLRVVTVSTDRVQSRGEVASRLTQLKVASDAYVFGAGSVEALRYSIDPQWLGEKPRAYFYRADGTRELIQGVLPVERLR